MIRRYLNRASTTVLSVVAIVFAFGSGCGQSSVSEATGQAQSALSANSDEVLGFENPSDWHVTSSPSVPLSASSTHSQGTSSLAVPARGYVTVQGATIAIASALPSTISFDLFLPPAANPSWAGAAQLYVDCHSHNLFNQYLGQQELTGQPVGQFDTESYSVPASIQTALSAGCSDLSFTIALNVPTNSTGTYLLDNLQLGGPPAVVSCGATLGTLGDAGATALTIAFSSQLTRPDLGTFVLNSTSVQSAVQTVTRSIALNGSPLLSFTSQAGSSGTSTSTATVFPPIVGVHQLSATSDGTNVTLVVDGRQTLPMPVGTTISAFTFVDGQPAPQVTVPAGLGAAVTQLLTSAGTQSPACLAAQSTSGGAGGSPSTLIADVGTDQGHPSTVSGLQCEGCEWTCYGVELGCAAAAPFTFECSILTGLFGFFGELACTVVVDTTACTEAMLTCERHCSAAGSSCCPVDCGGAGNATPPTGLGCVQGETCLKRGSEGGFLGGGAFVGICCSAGQVACGGTGCCGSDTTCLPRAPNGPPAMCCPPSQVALPGTYCCLLGGCKSDADCPGNACGSDGCCRIP